LECCGVVQHQQLMHLLLLLLLCTPNAAGVEAAAPIFAAMPFKSASACEAAVRSNLHSSSSSSSNSNSSGEPEGVKRGVVALCGDVAAETAILLMHMQAAAIALCNMPEQAVQFAQAVNSKQTIAVQMAPIVSMQLSCLKVAHAVGSRVASTELMCKMAIHTRNVFSMCGVLPAVDPAAADRAAAAAAAAAAAVLVSHRVQRMSKHHQAAAAAAVAVQAHRT
jgi:hypothetical protein